jgi:hypothetical protein
MNRSGGRRKWAGIAAGALLLAGSTASAAAWRLETVLSPPPSLGGVTAVAMDGDTLVVGSYDGTPLSVYIQTAGVWSLQQQIPWPANNGATRGLSLALSGDTLVVGDGRLGDGSADVFLRSGSTWTHQQTLVPPDGTPSYYGYAVAIDGDTIVVGDPAADAGAGPLNAAYVFTRSGVVWSLATILQPYPDQNGTPGLGSGDAFGRAVAVKGDRVAVGAPLEAAPNLGLPGAVYVFSIPPAPTPQVVIPADAQDRAFFGAEVALNGTTLFVGAPNLAQLGGVYVVDCSMGACVVEQQLPLPPDVVNLDSNFGYSVRATDSALLVSAPFTSTATTLGSLYLYGQSGSAWSLTQELGVPTSDCLQLGVSTTISGDTLASACSESHDGMIPQSAFVFTSTPPTVPALAGAQLCGLVVLLGAAGTFALRRRAGATR